MALAARKPQVSTPSDSFGMVDNIDMEDVSFAFDTWIPTGLADEIDLDITDLLIGTSVYIALDTEVNMEDQLFHFYLRNIDFFDEIDLEVYQNFTEQLIPVVDEPEVDNSDAVGRLDNLEHDLARSSTNSLYYKEFAYVGESLSGYSIYTDSSKMTKLFEITFNFSGDTLISKSIQRISDNKILTVTFGYSGGNLVSQTRSN